MAESEAANNYAVHPLTLHYGDKDLEAAYKRRTPAAMSRGLRPLLILLVPFMLTISVLEFLGVIESLVNWPTAGTLGAVLIWLFLMSSVVKRFVETSLVITFLIYQFMLLRHVETDTDLVQFLPGFFMMILLSNFVGMRYTYGLGASMLLFICLTVAVYTNGLDLMIIANGSLFLVPGIIVAASAAYTIDRQRRRFFAQVVQMELEREKHEKLAMHDPLTDLPNRSLLRERMEQSVARAKRQHGQFAVLFVDLDDFKTVNDSYGHAIGDKVLKSLADSLLKQVRGEDTVARLGGDEFVILSEQIVDERGAQIAADRIQAAVSDPIVVNLPERGDEIHINVTCSIGISLCPRDGDSLEHLVSRADEAMYSAKRDGKSTARFFKHTGEALARDATDS